MSVTKKPFKIPTYKTYDTSEGFGDKTSWRNAFYKRMSNEEATEVISQQKGSPHAILGVSDNATKDEIKKAFRKLMLQWHPDRNNNSPESELMTKKIIAAYTILTK